MAIAPTLLSLMALAAPLLLGGPICFFGADLDQDKAKDTAKDLVNSAASGGARGSVGTDIAGGDILNTMKTAAGSCYNAETGKFECADGVLLIYISSHGDATPDGKDTVIGNIKKQPNVTLSDLTKAIAPTIPECCTVIFAIDACFTDAWYSNFINAPDNQVNPNNPFKDVNWVVATPSGQGRCFGTPVGSAISKSFGTSRKASDLSDFLASQKGVQSRWGLDPEHDYSFKLTPEPATLWLSLVALAPIVWRRRRPRQVRR